MSQDLKKRKNISVFRKIKLFEGLFFLSVIFSLIMVVDKKVELNFLQLLVLFGSMGALVYMIFYIKMLIMQKFASPKSPETITNYQKRMVFNGNLDAAMLLLYQAGLKLRNKVGKYYIFTTNFRLIPNEEFIIQDMQEYCILQSSNDLIKSLQIQVDLKDLEKVSVTSNKDASRYHTNLSKKSNVNTMEFIISGKAKNVKK